MKEDEEEEEEEDTGENKKKEDNMDEYGEECDLQPSNEEGDQFTQPRSGKDCSVFDCHVNVIQYHLYTNSVVTPTYDVEVDL